MEKEHAKVTSNLSQDDEMSPKMTLSCHVQLKAMPVRIGLIQGKFFVGVMITRRGKN